MTDRIIATGRRKESVARVRLIPGTGKILINGKTPEDYFGGRESYLKSVMLPLETANVLGRFDIIAKVEGGGTTGQVEAVRLGIARALVEYDESLRPVLRKEGLLTRDPREVERKKYGLKKARRAPQFSKR
ncbi:MAG: 30S ribosomal protein S9 [Actinobacteria bacterium]|nr:30S ribosomal protein S9 [Actinomycetota bacterium]